MVSSNNILRNCHQYELFITLLQKKKFKRLVRELKKVANGQLKVMSMRKTDKIYQAINDDGLNLKQFQIFLHGFASRIIQDVYFAKEGKSVIPIFTRWENLFVESMLGVIFKHKNIAKQFEGNKTLQRQAYLSRFVDEELKVSCATREHHNFLISIFEKAIVQKADRKTVMKQSLRQAMHAHFTEQEASFLSRLNQSTAPEGVDYSSGDDSVTRSSIISSEAPSPFPSSEHKHLEADTVHQENSTDDIPAEGSHSCSMENSSPIVSQSITMENKSDEEFLPTVSKLEEAKNNNTHDNELYKMIDSKVNGEVSEISGDMSDTLADDPQSVRVVISPERAWSQQEDDLLFMEIMRRSYPHDLLDLLSQLLNRSPETVYDRFRFVRKKCFEYYINNRDQ